MYTQTGHMKQHYVPECYLRGFADANDNLFYLYLEGIKKGWNVYPRRSNTSGVCYQEDYYEVPKNNHSTVVLDNSENGYVESVLGVNESLYPAIRNKFLLGDNLTREDYIFLSDFIVQLKLRNPIWHNLIRKQAPKWL